MSEDITNVQIPPGGSAQQTGQNVEVTDSSGKKKSYGSSVNSESIPIVNPETERENKVKKAFERTNDTVDKSQSTVKQLSNGRVDPKIFNTRGRNPTWKTYDQRVRLEVPRSYLVGAAKGPRLNTSESGVLELNNGIVFPYSPTIEITHSADYSEINALHSNYTQYFYKNSKVSSISVKGKFTCQNEFEARILLAVLHLSRALTKMQFGNDPDAGSPPPICRLMGYGQYMFDNVPVAVKTFNMNVPNDVDYITINQDEINDLGNTSIPVVTEISFELIPMYSKSEMLNATVTGWLNGISQRLDGYL